MTIAIDGRSLQGARGGIDIYTYQLLNRLFTNHPQHSYILYFNGYKSFAHPFSHYSCLQIIHTRIPSKVFNGSIMLFGAPKLDKLLENLIGKPIDVFFMPNMHFAAFSPEARVVLTIHDLSFVHYSYCLTLKSRWWHASLRPKALIDRCQRILAVSEYTKNDVTSNYQIDPAKVSVIPLAVDDITYSNDTPEKLPVILAFCPQEGRKNIEALIEAFSLALSTDERMQNSYLVLAGVCGIPRRIKQAIARNHLTGKVRYVHYVSRERAIALLRSSRICVYPSIYEGFGLPPLEAILAGVPVIAGAHSSIPQTSGGGVWMCDPYNISELSDGLVRLYTDESLRNSLITEGRKYVQKYKWDETAIQTLGILEKVCA